jgi:PAS domain S-box-containing protein
VKNHGMPPLHNGRIDKTAEAPISVLCVDDEDGFLESTKHLLELETSFHVDLAYSVEDALEKMKSKVFDVIVSDYQMPGKSGLDFLKELRDSGNNIPFILFTGKGREEVAVEALNLGAARYFNKFGNPETVYCELVHGIRQAVAQRQVEKEMWDREERLRAIFASSPDAMIVTDLHGIITDCNLETLKLLEASSMSEIVGKHYQTLLAKDEQEKIGATVKELFETGFLANPESKVLTKSGSKIAIEFSASTLRDAYGKPVGAIALARNISDRKKAEAELRQSESKFRSFFENSPDYCYIISPKGEILEINKSALEALGYSKKELLGKQFLTTIYTPSSRKKVRKVIEKWKQTGKIQNKELEIVTKKGEKRVVLLSGHSVCDVNGRLLHYVTVQKDVTEHKKADEALRISEEKYRAVVEQAPDSIMTFDLTGVITDYNPAGLAFTGFSEGQFIGKNFADLIPLRKKDLPRFMKMYEQLLDGKVPEPFEVSFQDKKGNPHFGEVHMSLMKKGNKITGFQAIMRDITEKKRAEDALRNSEEKYRNIVELSPDGIISLDMNGNVTSVNRAILDQTGFSEKEFLGKHFTQLAPIPAENLSEFLKKVNSFLRGGTPDVLEFVYCCKDGTHLLAEARVGLLKQNGEPSGFQVILRDITERKKAEEALRESEKRFRELSELLPEVIFETDNKGVLKFVNHAAYTRFGYSHEEFETGLYALQMIAPEDRDRAKENMRKVMSGETLGSNEYNAVNKDGTIFPMMINSTPVLRGDKIVGMRGLMVDITERKKSEEALRESEKRFRELSELLPEVIFEIDLTGVISFVNRGAFDLFGFSEQDVEKGWNLVEMLTPESQEKAKEDLVRILSGENVGASEYTIVRKDGSTFPCIAYCSAIIKENKPVGIRGIIVDITERKKAEDELKDTLKKMETLNEKLSVIGKLTRHDARNKLSVIANNAYLAKNLLNKDHAALANLNSIESSIDQIEKILEFSRVYEMLGTEELSYIDVNRSFEAAVQLLSCPDNIKLATECEDLKVRADSSLSQIFYNLIDNSMRHGEKVSHIKVYCGERKEGLKIVYEDNGAGIPEDEKERIFEEGYGKGTGYGLYLIKKICESYDWTIREKGVPGKGAKFVMTIPKLNKNGKPNYTLNTE